MKLFLDGLALLAGMAGFWTLLSQTHLLRKIAGWLSLQAGLGITLLTLMGGGRNPLPGALILDLTLVSLGLGAFLSILARLIRRERRTLNSKILTRVEDAP
jgi:multisubunit Na+/H+ antiporter MnhC subunit